MFFKAKKIFIFGFFIIIFSHFYIYSMEKYHTLNLSNSSLTSEDLESDFWKKELQKIASDKQITTINLSGNKLTYIPEYLLKLPQELILDNNPLSNDLDKPKNPKRGSIGDDIKHTQDVMKQISTFFSSKKTKKSNKYKLIKLNNTVIIIAPDSNIKHQELDLNSETKLVFISPQKQESKISWMIKYVIGGVATASCIVTGFITYSQILEFIKTWLCGCE